jgi:serine phosphatase RsbU (regulator of sigma subunit)
MKYFFPLLVLWLLTNGQLLLAQTPADVPKSKELLGKLVVMTKAYAIPKPDSAALMAGQAVELARHFRDTSALLTSLQFMGNHSLKLAQHQASLDFALQQLAIYQAQRDTTGSVETLNQMAIIFRQQRKFAEGLQLLREAMALLPRPNQVPSLAGKTTNNIGSTHYMAANYDSALFYFEKSYQYRLKSGQEVEIAKSLNNLGLIHKRRGEHAKALKNFMACKQILERSADSLLVTNTLDNIGDMYNLLGQPETAKKYHLQGLVMARRAGIREKVWDSYESLAETYTKLGDYKTALTYALLKSSLKDSLFDEQNARQVGELKSRFDSEKQAKEIALLTKENQIKDLEAAVNERRNWFLFIGLALASGLALVAWSRFRLKNKANRLLQSSNQEINQQKEELLAQRDSIAEKSERLSETMGELDKKNRDMMGSLNYASRIQNAILPRLATIQQQLPDSFVFYRPKEIVSGDFYWFAQLPAEEQEGESEKFDKLVIVAADCTGHGVPGAFMSLIGSKLLGEIVLLGGLTAPDQVLAKLDKGVRANLRQHETANRDGMDIAICVLHRTILPGQTMPQVTHLEFAGARNPLVLVRGGELLEFKGCRMSVGGGKENEQQSFVRHVVQTQPGDMCYLYSDGYQDQFGGAENRKLMPRRLKNLLTSHYAEPALQQQQIFAQTFTDWQGNNPQIDDVLLLGFRV